MRYKYVVKKDEGKDRLRLDEYARIEAEAFSLLNQETFDLRSMKSAVSGSRQELISVLRTENLYPPSDFIEKIADAVARLIGSENLDAAEVIADDREFIKEKAKKSQAPKTIEPEIPEIELAEDVDAEVESMPHPMVPLNESTVSFDDLFPFDEVA